MSKRRVAVVLGLMSLFVPLGLALVSGSLLGQAQAQGLPPGVHLEVLAEYPATEPGIEKIVVKKFTLDPGAKLENFTVPITSM